MIAETKLADKLNLNLKAQRILPHIEPFAVGRNLEKDKKA